MRSQLLFHKRNIKFSLTERFVAREDEDKLKTMEAVHTFNYELSSIHETSPSISDSKMTRLTESAMNARNYYKHVVEVVEKFAQTCKPIHKITALYVIDSIVDQSRQKFGPRNDVFAPRFIKNILPTFQNLLKCPPDKKSKIVRVLTLWERKKIFETKVLQPLLALIDDPNNPEVAAEVQRAVHDIENKHVSKSEAGSASNFGTTISTVHSLDQETEQHIEDIDNSRSTQIEIPAKDSRLLQTLQMPTGSLKPPLAGILPGPSGLMTFEHKPSPPHGKRGYMEKNDISQNTYYNSNYLSSSGCDDQTCRRCRHFRDRSRSPNRVHLSDPGIRASYRISNSKEIHGSSSMVIGKESRQVPVSLQQSGYRYSGHQETFGILSTINDKSGIQTIDKISNNNVEDSTSRQQPHAVQQAIRQPVELQQMIKASSVDRAHSIEGEQNRDMFVDLGLTLERPKYPAYAQLRVRIDTFQGWPGYLDQAPRDMAMAGFFFAGQYDYCTCFFCGGGIRNWKAGDDPWVEHASCFSKCAFVRQIRGDRFVEVVVKEQAEMQASFASGSFNKQTVETITQSEVVIQGTSENLTTLSATATSNRDPAIENVRDMGYTDEMIKRAIDNIKQNNPGKEKMEATEIVEMIFTITVNDVTQQTNTDFVSEIRSLQEENTQLKEQVMCKICMDKNVSIAFLPCGHLACCIECAPAMRNCPMCRISIEGTFKTYLA